MAYTNPYSNPQPKPVRPKLPEIDLRSRSEEFPGAVQVYGSPGWGVVDQIANMRVFGDLAFAKDAGSKKKVANLSRPSKAHMAFIIGVAFFVTIIIYAIFGGSTPAENPARVGGQEPVVQEAHNPLLPLLIIWGGYAAFVYFYIKNKMKYVKRLKFAKMDASSSFSYLSSGQDTVKSLSVHTEDERPIWYGAMGEYNTGKNIETAIAKERNAGGQRLSQIAPAIIAHDLECYDKSGKVNAGKRVVSANIDHLVVHDRGIIMIDAKVWGKGSLDFVNERVNGKFMSLVRPGSRAAHSVATCIYESTFLPVQPDYIIFSVGGGAGQQLAAKLKSLGKDSYFITHYQNAFAKWAPEGATELAFGEVPKPAQGRVVQRESKFRAGEMYETIDYGDPAQVKIKVPTPVLFVPEDWIGNVTVRLMQESYQSHRGEVTYGAGRIWQAIEQERDLGVPSRSL